VTEPKVTGAFRPVRLRDDPPEVWFIIDQLSLYRLVGSPEVLTAQMRHLAAIKATEDPA
jgi:Domain of unknown function (DUF5753)